ncbi:Hypothetical predicted protein [Pelobates cultripes]|uniref:Amelogenin n=1 Tax=Pelobates cultripes TaxID=61616 RepID=A0AAD1WEJ8_PELCU|nr:Hypothetical predicted protein [Pelobates cultripes]
MHLGHRGSNSEEMPHVGSFYGLGLPNYSQMVQLQHALVQQPFSWLQQNAAKGHKDTISPPMPRFPINSPHLAHHQQPKQPPLPTMPQYQHVTKQHQPPPAPDPQLTPIFPPYPSGINPFHPYWQQTCFFPKAGHHCQAFLYGLDEKKI